MLPPQKKSIRGYRTTLVPRRLEMETETLRIRHVATQQPTDDADFRVSTPYVTVETRTDANAEWRMAGLVQAIQIDLSVDKPNPEIIVAYADPYERSVPPEGSEEVKRETISFPLFPEGSREVPEFISERFEIHGRNFTYSSPVFAYQIPTISTDLCYEVRLPFEKAVAGFFIAYETMETAIREGSLEEILRQKVQVEGANLYMRLREVPNAKGD